MSFWLRRWTADGFFFWSREGWTEDPRSAFKFATREQAQDAKALLRLSPENQGGQCSVVRAPLRAGGGMYVVQLLDQHHTRLWLMPSGMWSQDLRDADHFSSRRRAAEFAKRAAGQLGDLYKVTVERLNTRLEASA